MRAVLATLLLLGCGASHTQLARDRYEINCENGVQECKQMAWNLCPDGYSIEGGKSGTFTQTIVARCKTSPAETWREPARVTRPEPAPAQAPAFPPGTECVRNFHCTKPGSQCTDGKCVAPEEKLAADATNRCVVGVPGSGGPMAMFTTENAAVEFARHNAPNRDAAFELAVKLGATWVDSGVRCKTLQQRMRARYVQLLSGPLAGREGWMNLAPEIQPTDAGVD